MERLRQLFEKHNHEFMQFNLVKDKVTDIADLEAFFLLDRLQDGNKYIVSASDPETIYLGVDLENLSEVITEAEVIKLIRCGVMIQDECLYMLT